MSAETPQTSLTSTARAVDYVLPHPPRGPGEVLVQRESSAAVPGLLWPVAARNLACHLEGLAGSQQQLLGELQAQLAQSDAGIATEPRVRLKAELHTCAQITAWLAAAQEESALTAARLAQGQLPLDLLECAEFAAAHCTLPRARVQTLGDSGRPWWGVPTALQDLLAASLAAVAERTQGASALAVLVDGGARVPTVVVRGRGALAEDLDPGTIQRVRQAAARVGATVHPDEDLPGCSGLVLRLPVADAND